MRRPLIVAVSALLALSLYTANVAWWLDTQVLDDDRFVATTAESLALGSSRDFTAGIVVTRLIDQLPELAVVDAALVTVLSELLGTKELETLLVAVAEDLQQRIVAGDRSAVVIDLGRYRDTLLGPLQVFAPELASRVPDGSLSKVEVIKAGSLPSIPPVSRSAGAIAILSAVIGAALAAYVSALSRRWWAGLAIVGGSTVTAAALTTLLAPVVRSIALPGFRGESREILVNNLYNGFARTLSAQSWLLALVGIALVGIAAIAWANERAAPTG